jgi:hypothetical protein
MKDTQTQQDNWLTKFCCVLSVHIMEHFVMHEILSDIIILNICMVGCLITILYYYKTTQFDVKNIKIKHIRFFERRDLKAWIFCQNVVGF